MFHVGNPSEIRLADARAFFKHKETIQSEMAVSMQLGN